MEERADYCFSIFLTEISRPASENGLDIKPLFIAVSALRNRIEGNKKSHPKVAFKMVILINYL